MVEWECPECGHIHSSNPSECEKCSNTILIQHRKPDHERTYDDVEPETPTNLDFDGDDLGVFWLTVGLLYLGVRYLGPSLLLLGGAYAALLHFGVL